MAKYKVTLYCEVAKTYEVESEDADKALEQAYELDKNVGLEEYEYVDTDGFCVKNEDGDIVMEQ